MTSLGFYGGVETVTGSSFLLQTQGLRILIDCGMFQGEEKWEELNRAPFDFDPFSIDYLIVTHGHLDHTGRIPLLVKRGFAGSIVCTPGTYDIAKVVMMDSARLQEEDYAHWKKIWLRRGEKPRPPLYTTLDVLDAIRLFNRTVNYDEPLRLNSRVTITFRDAGHILGASSVVVDIKGQGRIIFSGDIGNTSKPIIRDPWMPDSADTVVMETTYADRLHRGFKESVEELRDVINTVFRRGGNVLIPAFAVERAQDLLFVLRELIKNGDIPPCKVYLDSPMGISVTDIMRRHPECFDEQTRTLIMKGEDPFWFPGLEFTREIEESKKINFIKSHAIIIAGSGMCTGGRIKHHLKHNIWRKESAVLFVGYQAEGTLGRKIVEGKKRVKIFGETYRVNASVHTIGGFSSHADRDILLKWLRGCVGVKEVFLVHGEDGPKRSFSKTLKAEKLAEKVYIPSYGESFSVFEKSI